ncbi:MAG: hypothetical protein IT462_16990 [Planctomycetes bacterium]|nr:hypothetical protein [Planctomycetota bacterium]
MAMFVHLTPSRNLRAIERGGIRAMKYGRDDKRGVFCMPVLPNFYASHQWLRELKAGGDRMIVGVYFRIADDEPVLVGHYGRAPTAMTATEASGFVRNVADPQGYQVVVPRKIEAKEIHKTRELPQVIGWRHYPDAHKAKTLCGCPVCVTPGSPKSNKKRAKFRADEDEIRRDNRRIDRLRADKELELGRELTDEEWTAIK